MNKYISILLWCGFVALLSTLKEFRSVEQVDGKKKLCFSFPVAAVIFLPLVVMAANRGYIADTTAYLIQYLKMPSSFGELPQYVAGVAKDKGFYFLSAVLHCIFGSNYVGYLFVIAAIQVFFLIQIYRKYSENFLLSFFLFVASTDYISWMFNGMRQFTAAAIVFGCMPWILKKKYVPAVVGIVIASLFHQSALIAIPFVFICQGEALNKKTMLVILGAVLAVAFVGEFTNLLDSALEDTQYKNVVSDWKDFQDDGTNPIRVLVYSVPAILAWFGRDIIRQKNDPVINLATNMSIVSTGIYLVSMVTSGVLIGRLPIYFSLYGYILLPWEVDMLFAKNTRGLIKTALVVLYLGFYYYQNHFAWGMF